MIMKNQLLNLKMIALMCLMMVLGGANVWAQDAQTIFLETFGANPNDKAVKFADYANYSATAEMFTQGNAKSNYTGDGSIGKKSLKDLNVSSGYTGASGNAGCYNDQSGEHEIIKISNINIKSFNSLKLSFGVLGGSKSGHKIDVSYIIDGGEENALPSKDVTNTKWDLLTYDIPVTGSNLTLIFSHNPKKTWTIRVDDIKLTGVKAAAEPTYTQQTPVTFRAEDNGYYATFSNDKVTFITSDNSEAYKIVVSAGNIVKTKFEEVAADINGKTVKGFYIPANTGILLYSIAETADYYTVENKTVDALAKGTNMLMPAPANGGEFTAETGKVYYKLAYGDWTEKTQLGFYWGAPEGGKFFVKAGTAYLAVPEAKAAGAKGFTLNGEATGIESVNANVENAKAIYNLNGQRVASMAKPGLYIVNGKKIVRK